MTNAGMKVIFSIGAGQETLLTGVELSWTQEYKRFYPCGSYQPANVFTGPIAWEGKYTKAFGNTSMMGSFNVGTISWLGTVFPAGGTNPLVAGTILLTGGALTNLQAESVDAAGEEHSFVIYNMTFTN